MDLDFTEEQDAFRSNLRDFLTTHHSPAQVRVLERDELGYSPEFWERFSALGAPGLLIPEEYGGAGLPLLDSVVLYEELGRAIVPSPHFVSSVLSARLIETAGTEAQKAQWLPELAAGEAIITPAWLEPSRGYGPEGVQLRARRDGSGWVLSGGKYLVHYAGAATRLIVLARTQEEGSGAEIRFLLVDPQVPGVTLTRHATMASDNQFHIAFDDVHVAADDVLTEAAGWDAWHRVMLDGITLLAAQAVGGARRALELATEYAGTRHQFGKPLGAFQAIAHNLADRATEVDGAEVLVWEAAWARDTGRSTQQLAPMAKLFGCQVFRKVTATAQQIFGGNGFTVDFDIQLYFRRAKQLELSFWDARYLESLIAAVALTPDVGARAEGVSA